MVALFSVTLFLSAALMFSVQPMYARFVLPLFGGTPAVWNTAMLFFQFALLAGYLYAHETTRRLGVRRQAALHLGVVLLPLLVLPLGVPDGAAAPAGGASPVGALLGLLLVAVGLPFFVVSATAPLLQRWLAETNHPAARDPYFLYRASNLGSVIGLLAYPLAAEPSLRLGEQGLVWAAGYAGLIALVAACAVVVWRSGPAPGGEPSASRVDGPPDGGGPGQAQAAPGIASPSGADESVTASISARRRLRWIFLAFVPSSLMLGVTTYLTVDLAPIPLLWSLPLSLYLISFILAFAPGARNERRQRIVVLILPLVALVLSIALVLEAHDPLWLLLPLHLAGFFVAALACHGELARDRPPARRLTEFYIWVAVGGALGGVFNALLAPVLFDSLLEYPLLIVLACLCLPGRPGRFPSGPQTRPLDFGVPVLLGTVTATILALSARGGPDIAVVGQGFALSLAAGIALNFARRPLRFALSLAAILIAGVALAPVDPVIHQKRSFFGINRVEARPGGFHRLVNGTTTHGGQFTTPKRRLEPVTYYDPSGPVGQIMARVPRGDGSGRVAVLGLGSGGLACYAGAGERWTYYEIDPEVERLARDPRLFTYLRDCPGRHDVVLGDARLSLAGAPERAFGLIVGDVFSSDAVPAHLLTREALALYRSKLTEDGVLAMHISNRYLDLEPVVAALASDAGLSCLTREEKRRAPVRVPGKIPSHWAVMAERPTALARLAADPRWRPCRRSPGERVWTDDFSNIVGALDP
ncbi:MAG: fused MFS/spermidine synthase [Thermoleophilaceae bacterium]|nr:fused MFS/spermidine synthase [Thermoleophilaceae bacterium]